MKNSNSGISKYRRIACMFMALLCSALMLSGCDIDVLRPDSAGTSPFLSLPLFTLSESDYKLEEKHILYPEDSTEDTAQYVLTYSIPVFSDQLTHAEKMNTGIAMFEAELMKRVEDERLPYADRVQGQPAPYTEVTCKVTSARGFVNAVFTESYSYGNDVETITRSLVMSDGKRVGLSTASGAYDAQERAAQQILNIIADYDGEIAYYNDLILDDAVSAIDLYSGFYTVDEGYTLICRKGILAPDEYGEIELVLTAESMYPDVVGDVITDSEYEALMPVIDSLTYAAYTNYSSFASGNPDAVLSTAFMLSLVNKMQPVLEGTRVADDGLIYMERDKFLSLFSSIFDTQFKEPAEIAQGYIVEKDEEFELCHEVNEGNYRFALSDISLSGDTLVAVGEVMFGDPDGTNSRLCGAQLTLRHSDLSPVGYKLVSLEFN